MAKLPDGRPSKFHKSVYTLLNDNRLLKPCIIQYMGSMDGIVVSAKRSRHQAEKQSADSTSSTPSKRRRISIGSGSVNLTRPIVLPPQTLPISREDFRQLHELAYSLNGFVNTVQISPTFLCIVSIKDLSVHLEAMLQKNTAKDESIMFSYCSTYEIGNLALSPLLFTHVAFDGKPAIPTHFAIHERNDSRHHKELFRIVQEHVPSFKTVECPIVTESDAIKEACMAEMGLRLIPISSWKGAIQQTKEWLYQNGANQQEVATGLDDMRKLMSCESVEKYEEGLEQCKNHWGESLQEFFAANIDPMVRSKLGMWVIQQWGIFNPYTGVSDSKNDCWELVKQHLPALSSLSIHTILLACYLVQQFAKKEIKDGLNGMGRFMAKENSVIYKASISNWQPIPFLCLPENIVPYIKNDQLVIQEGALIERAEIDAKKTLLNKGKRIYENGGVHHNIAIQSFVVKEWERPDESFLVKLHPRATCSCDSSMFCQHIIAVKMSIGVDMESDMERLDTKFVSRALKSCENAAEGIKPRRRRRKKQGTDMAGFDVDAARKRDSTSFDGHQIKGTIGSDGDESENESDVTGAGQDNTHVDFFQTGGQIGFSMNFQ